MRARRRTITGGAALKRILSRVVLILLLLFAQYGALAHAIWHIQDRLPAGTQQDDAHRLFHAGLCSYHYELGEMLGAVHPAVFQTPAACLVNERIAQRVCSVATAESITAHSRGPPALL